MRVRIMQPRRTRLPRAILFAVEFVGAFYFFPSHCSAAAFIALSQPSHDRWRRRKGLFSATPAPSSVRRMQYDFSKKRRFFFRRSGVSTGALARGLLPLPAGRRRLMLDVTQNTGSEYLSDISAVPCHKKLPPMSAYISCHP